MAANLTRIPGAYHVTKVEAPLRPPTSLDAIENAILRQRARDAWLAAMRLRRIIDGWWSWLLKLKNEGDADPAETLHLRENATTNARVLCTLRVNTPSFRGPPEHLIRLLPEPAGFNKLPSVTDEATRGKKFKDVVAAVIPWQKDEAFIQQTWDRLENLTELQGELMDLAKLIEASPSAAFLAEGTRAAEDLTASVPSDEDAEQRGYCEVTGPLHVSPKVDTESDLPDDMLLSSKELAERFSLDAERLRKRLDRWRAHNVESDDWVEAENPRPRTPRYLYRVRIARPIIASMKEARASDETSG